ncbi:MAG: OadG family protein [Firmicutes bacterium]|nr:OadG family protein [Bacillota bacterium]
MSLGEIAKVALTNTALGMGTVFCVLIIISIVIWILGIVCRKERLEAAPAAPELPGDRAALEEPADSGFELEAAIVTAAIQKFMSDQNVSTDEYIVRNVRRATWKHI